jgi:phosphoenolpyruvate carboxylase
MSTQHPDNVSPPPWTKEEVLAGDAEIEETFYAFSELGCQEQMWDWEGKDADPNVVRKLFATYPDYFKTHRLGRDVFLTLRIANPSIERTEQKAVIEALASIPRSYDVASNFYSGEAIPPIFEVILPMTSNAAELVRIASYYERLVTPSSVTTMNNDDEVSSLDWIGEFNPKQIAIIPLLENFESLLNADEIVGDYIKRKTPSHIRVFLGRSDPALNYGMISAVLLCKIALAKLGQIANNSGVAVYPILGAGSLPFRGNLTPLNLPSFLQQYSGIRTATIQSSLKYDFEKESTKSLIRTLNSTISNSQVPTIERDQFALLEVIARKLTACYQSRVEQLAGLVNTISSYVPRRRDRRLHIGLFGYSRQVGTVKLPRAIDFTASLYSIGVPPELLGLQALGNLTENEYATLNEFYPQWKNDLQWAGNYLCWENINMLSDDQDVVARVTRPYNLGRVIAQILSDIEEAEVRLGARLGPRTLSQRKHQNISNNTLIALAEEAGGTDVARYIIESGRLRYSLG